MFTHCRGEMGVGEGVAVLVMGGGSSYRGHGILPPTSSYSEKD